MNKTKRQRFEISEYIKYSEKRQMNHLSLVMREPVFGVSDQVPHKPGCTATEDG